MNHFTLLMMQNVDVFLYQSVKYKDYRLMIEYTLAELNAYLDVDM